MTSPIYPSKPSRLRDADGNVMHVAKVHPTHLPRTGEHLVVLDDINHPQEPREDLKPFSRRGSFKVVELSGHGKFSDHLTEVWVKGEGSRLYAEDESATMLIRMEDEPGGEGR